MIHKKPADVVSIFRVGDTVLISAGRVYFVVEIRNARLKDGVIWIRGIGLGAGAAFDVPATAIVARVAFNSEAFFPEDRSA